MQFREVPLSGAYVIQLDPIGDERGFFARAFDRQEFEKRGLTADVAQCNYSYNRARGTVRGFHYQAEPAAETKLIRCVRGAIHNVIVDVRPESSSYLRHFAVELSATNRLALYVPGLIATAMQTLDDDTEVYYQVSQAYAPDAERGIRHDDPALGVTWPLPVAAVSEKDRTWPSLEAPG